VTSEVVTTVFKSTNHDQLSISTCFYKHAK